MTNYAKWYIKIQGEATPVEVFHTKPSDPQLSLKVKWFTSGGVQQSVVTYDDDETRKVLEIMVEPLCVDLGDDALVKIYRPYRDNLSEWIDLSYELPPVGGSTQSNSVGTTTTPGWNLTVKVKPKVTTAC